MSSVLTKKAIASINEYNMLRKFSSKTVTSVIVALSGGADSVALLDFLIRSKNDLNLTYIFAIHINHNLRKQAKSDEVFVAKLCKTLNIKLSIYDFDVNKYAKENKLTTEEAGRNLRYSAFLKEAKNIYENTDSLPHIATAHTLSDTAETVLLNLARGTGLNGLSGIPPIRKLGEIEKGQKVYIMRPLINCLREEVEDYCDKYDLSFVTDETNFDTVFARNRIRLNVLPELRKINLNVFKNIKRMTKNVRDDNEFLENHALRKLEKAKLASPLYSFEGYSVYDTYKLKSLERPIFVRAINQAVSMINHKLFLSSKQSDIIYEGTNEDCPKFALDIDGDTQIKVSQNLFRVFTKSSIKNSITEEFKKIEICLDLSDKTCYNASLKANFEENDDSCSLTYDFYNRGITFKVIPLSDFCEEQKKTKNHLKNCCDYDKIKGTIVLRSRTRGDSFSPVNRSGEKSLKKLFIDEKIPTEIRNRIPVLLDDDGIIMVVGFGCDTRVKVDNYTKNVLVVKEI